MAANPEFSLSPNLFYTFFIFRLPSFTDPFTGALIYYFVFVGNQSFVVGGSGDVGCGNVGSYLAIIFRHWAPHALSQPALKKGGYHGRVGFTDFINRRDDLLGVCHRAPGKILSY